MRIHTSHKPLHCHCQYRSRPVSLTMPITITIISIIMTITITLPVPYYYHSNCYQYHYYQHHFHYHRYYHGPGHDDDHTIGHGCVRVRVRVAVALGEPHTISVVRSTLRNSRSRKWLHAKPSGSSGGNAGGGGAGASHVKLVKPVLLSAPPSRTGRSYAEAACGARESGSQRPPEESPNSNPEVRTAESGGSGQPGTDRLPARGHRWCCLSRAGRPAGTGTTQLPPSAPP